MVAGGIIQLITSHNEHNLYLTENPQISFFKTVYKRHTNFSFEIIDEVFDTSPDFGKHSRLTIPKSGDLLSNMTLHIKIDSINSYDNTKNANKNIKHINSNINCACEKCIKLQLGASPNYGWVNSLGHALIQCTWIEIGGRKIDKQYGEWLEIWTELTQPYEKRQGYFQMIGKVEPITFNPSTFTGEMDLYVPLNFWFCKNYGLALPLCSLPYQDIDLMVDFRKFEECWVSSIVNIVPPKKPRFDARILIEYIFIDIVERQKFYNQSHVYLIEQVQFNSDSEISSITANVDLYFNNPVKELLWTFQRTDVDKTKDWFNYGPFLDRTNCTTNDWFNYSTFLNRSTTAITRDPFQSGALLVNGTFLFDLLDASFFRLLQPYYRHTRISNNYIYTYSFALRPEVLQPSGQLNFSSVDNVRLLLNMNTLMTSEEKGSYLLRVYALSYNVLYISGGLGGLIWDY
jgi:hypothetical protein